MPSLKTLIHKEQWDGVLCFSLVGRWDLPAFFCVQSLYMLRKNQKSTRFPCQYTEEKLADSLSDCSGLCLDFISKPPNYSFLKISSLWSLKRSQYISVVVCFWTLFGLLVSCIGWIFEPARITVPWSILGPLTYRLPSLEASVLKSQRNIYACQYLSVDFISLWSSWFWV